MNIIVAVDEQDCIGNNNELIYDVSVDKTHFKRLTLHSAVVMGKNTWESLPIKPLPNRINIIISTTLCDVTHPNTFIYNSFELFMQHVHNNKYKNPFTTVLYPIFIIGGSQLYDHVLNQYEVDTIYKTVIIDSNTNKTVLHNPVYFTSMDESYVMHGSSSIITTKYTCQYHNDHTPIECVFNVYKKTIRI